MKDPKKTDDFWDLAKLLPQKKTPTFVRPHQAISLTDVKIDGESSPNPRETRLTRSSFSEKSNENASIYPTAEKIAASEAENRAAAKPLLFGARSNSEKVDIASQENGVFHRKVGIEEKESSESVLSVGKECRTGEADESRTYTPKNNPFLLSVTVTRKKSIYSFYEHFARDARRYFNEKGEECEYTRFFSYIPQYSQLNPKQRAYYFYFRDSVRAGRYIKTDFSYFMLLVYEILNLPDLVPPESGISFLCRLFCAYRKDFPQMDKYLSVWIPDYCLLYGLPAPTAELAPILREVLAATDFKEFYLGNAGELSPTGIDSLLALASDYQYRYSRYVTEENLEKMTRVMHASLRPVISRLLAEENLAILATEKTREHEAFTGSLCAHNLRARLSVVYRPFSETPRFRSILTQAVKYTENRLRARLSVKSRLSVVGLPPAYREIISRVLDGLPTQAAEVCVTSEERRYLALYEAESHGFSEEESAEIESSSWETTRRLTEGIECDSDAVADLCEEASQGSDLSEAKKTSQKAEKAGKADFEASPLASSEAGAVPSGVALRYGLSPTAFAYLCAIVRGDSSAQETLLRQKSAARELLYEEINGAFYIHFGDVILENGPEEPLLIEDYRSEVESFIRHDGILP